MIFTEPRSDIHDLAKAVERLVREQGPQSIAEVFGNLPDYINLTRGDLRMSVSRPNERMWQTEIRNLSRNQNPRPAFKRYRPILGCTLVYEGRKAGAHEGRFIMYGHVDQRASVAKARGKEWKAPR